MIQYYIILINYIGSAINILENNISFPLFFTIKDKLKTKRLLHQFNYPTTNTINKSNVKDNHNVVCKPISGKCGKGIYFFEPGETVPITYLNNNVYFCEEYEVGKHYRIVMYKDRIVTVLERLIPTVTGDGIHNITELVDRENIKRSGKNKILLDTKHKGYIPTSGEYIQCNKLCNFSTGGSAMTIDIHTIPNKTKKMFIQLNRDIKLNLFSIDLISSDITLEIPDQEVFCINELEYCNDWDINFILRDSFSQLGIILIIKWIIYFIIIKELYQVYNHTIQ